MADGWEQQVVLGNRGVRTGGWRKRWQQAPWLFHSLNLKQDAGTPKVTGMGPGDGTHPSEGDNIKCVFPSVNCIQELWL